MYRSCINSLDSAQKPPASVVISPWKLTKRKHDDKTRVARVHAEEIVLKEEI